MNNISTIANLLTDLLLGLFQPGEVLMITSMINQNIKKRRHANVA